MSPTLLDVARGSRFLYGPSGDVVATIPRGEQDELLPVIEALAVRNAFLQDVPWKARVTGLVDERGNAIYVEIK